MNSKPATAQITNVQMEQVKSVVRSHLEQHKFFDSLKSAMAKDPKLGQLDRQKVIEKLKSEGVLTNIINDLPINKQQSKVAKLNQEMAALGTQQTKPRKVARTDHLDELDPNKRYMSCTVVRGSAFVDFVNERSDESISVAVSFLKQRYHTRMVQCSSMPAFDETFVFEFAGDNDRIKFDAQVLLKLQQPLIITILKHRRNERAVVMGTKQIEWRSLLYCNQVEINTEVLPTNMA